MVTNWRRNRLKKIDDFLRHHPDCICKADLMNVETFLATGMGTSQDYIESVKAKLVEVSFWREANSPSPADRPPLGPGSSEFGR